MNSLIKDVTNHRLSMNENDIERKHRNMTYVKLYIYASMVIKKKKHVVVSFQKKKLIKSYVKRRFNR